MHKQICHEIVALSAPKKRQCNVLERLHAEELDIDDVIYVDVRVRKPDVVDLDIRPVLKRRAKLESCQVGQNLDCYA